MRLLFILVFVSKLLLANTPLTISQDNTSYIVGSNLSYFIDKDNSLSIEDIQNEEFIPHTKDIANFGFLSPTHWFKLQLNYKKEMLEKDWWLSIDYPLLDFVDFYMFNADKQLIFHKKEGDLNRDSEKELLQNRILFSLEDSSLETYTLYIKVTTSSSMLVPMHIISNRELIHKTHLSQSVSGLYYGILLILILYNMITFLYTREKIYSLYVLFVVSYALWQLSFDGLGILYFWGDIEWMREKSTVFFIYTSSFTLLLFTQSLLKAKENIFKYNKFLLNPLLYISFFGILATVILPYKYTIVLGALLAISVPTALFIAGLMVMKKDYYSIRLSVIGLGIFLLGTILFTLSKFSLLDNYLIMKYGQQIGSAIEMILLSGALVQRFKRLQEEYTQKLRDHNKDLEEKVKIALQKERHKDQMLIEQSKLASMGEMIEQIAHQWRQPLNNIGLINQDLYFKNLLGTLSADDFEKLRTQIDKNIEYMSDTIDDFRTYYDVKKVKETYYLDSAIDTILSIIEATLKHHKINISIDIIQKAVVHNVKNELFQVFLNIINNAKDALISSDNSNKMIFITSKSDSEYCYVTIEDNGGGIPDESITKIFDPYFTTKNSKEGTGIGLYMSKTIIEKNMSGTISAENVNDGARFTIKLPLSEN